MDAKVFKITVVTNDVIFDGCIENPFECDYVLPDYYPDIRRVLKCMVTPQIHTKQLVGDKLTVEGLVNIRLIYIPAGSPTIRAARYECPFSKTIELKNTASDAFIRANAYTGYVNTRVSSPRRVDVRGVIEICARVIAPRKEQIVSECEGGGIQLLQVNTHGKKLVTSSEKIFKISDEIELATGKPSVMTVLRSEAVPIITDYKAIQNKIIIKGEALITTTYMPVDELGKPEKMEHSIPLSQIIDLEGIDDDCECDIRLSTLSVDAIIRTDASGENRNLGYDISFSAVVSAFKSESSPIVVDAYSVDYELELSTKELAIEDYLGTCKESYLYREAIELVDDKGVALTDVLDVWCTASQVASIIEDSEINVSGKILFSVLAMDSEGEPMMIEKQSDFNCPIRYQQTDKQIRIDSMASCIGVSFSFQGAGNIEVRADMRIESSLYTAESMRIIENITVDESKVISTLDKPPMIIYFADKGENLWEIAKNFKTSMSRVKDENEIDEQILSENRKLIITTL